MDIDEERTKLYSLLGFSIEQWSHVEDQLFDNFLIAISQRRERNAPAQAAFYAIQSLGGKLGMANSAVHFRLRMGMTKVWYELAEGFLPCGRNWSVR